METLGTRLDDFDSANPSSMQDACHMNSVEMTLLSVSSCSSVDRMPAWSSAGHGLDSCQDSDFSLSHAHVQGPKLTFLGRRQLVTEFFFSRHMQNVVTKKCQLIYFFAAKQK